jgi:cell volume regulation protein A
LELVQAAKLPASSLHSKLATPVPLSVPLKSNVAVLLVLGFIAWITEPSYGIGDMAWLFVRQLTVGAAVGVAVGFLLDDWTEALAGAIGGVLGGFGSIQIVRGALRRGGTAGGTGILVGLAGLGVAALALVPVVGYLEALALPSLGARLRRRRPERYAGLRSLARD